MRSKSFVIVAALAATFPAAAAAADTTFNPEVPEVCTATPAGPWVVNRDAFIGQLIDTRLSTMKLRPDGQAVTPQMKLDALLNPAEFCAANGCKPETAAALGSLYYVLNEFLNVYSGASPPAKFRVIGPASPRDFLASAGDMVTIQCFPTARQLQAKLDGKPTAPEGPRRYFGIRKNVDDFRYSQSDKEFKKLERATLAFKEDYEADSASFTIDGVAGYTFGPAPLGRSVVRLTPFVSYNQNEVNKPGISQDLGVYNLGGGAVGGILFPFAGIYQDLQFYPKFVHSFRNGAETLVSTLVYTPEPAWAYIGQVGYVVPDVLSVQFTPQLKAAWGVVYDEGTGPTTLENGDYFRWGPKIAAALYGESWLKGFLFNVSYETYQVSNAKISSLERFEASANYTIGDKELWALQLKYVNGQDLDTWEDQNQLTLGAGLKY